MRKQLFISILLASVFNSGVVFSQASYPSVRFINENLYIGSAQSIGADANLQQPWYRYPPSAGFYKMTYSSRQLENLIGIGGDGTSEWNTNGDQIANPILDGPIVIDESEVLAGLSGETYGTVTYSGHLNIFGYNLLMENTYTFGLDAKLIRVSTKFTNLSPTTVTNFRYWVGVPDDYLGGSDSPFEQRGNLIGNSFQQIGSASEQAKAVLVSNGDHRSLLYSWDPRAQTVLGGCCSLPIGSDPFTNYVSLGGDGAYLLYLRMSDLAQGESDSFTWYIGGSDMTLFDALLYDNNELEMADITINSATLLATSYQTGDGYYVVVPRGADAPTALQIKNGVDYGSVTVLASGQDAITVNNQKSYPIMGLTPDFDYDLYFVAESGSVFSSVDKIEFTTLTCEGPQVDALKALYESLDGDKWAWSDPSKSWKDKNGNWRRFNNNGLNWEGVVMDDCDILSIDLSGKTLTGFLPKNIGDLTSLTSLKLGGNNIKGRIPESIKNLNFTEFSIRYNAVYTDDETVKNFIDQFDAGWDLTQTLPPVNLSAQLLNPSAIIKWTPIVYQGGTGRYFIKYRAEDEGGFTTITVEGKNSSEGLIPNLAYGKKYLVYVQSQTDGNPPFNPSAVTSDLGEVIELFFATPIAATERAALIALYEAMGGDDWTSNDNWKDPVNFSASGTEFLWKGVTLSKVNNVWSVTGIDLRTNNLNGTLPDLYAAFPNLRSLNLSGNCLAGAVPASLSSLQNLQSLNLSDNRFNSFTLTSLSATDVNLSYNALGGTGDNTALLAQLQADYLATQTLTPSGISATTVGDASATVSWQAIAFTAGEGHYELRLRKVGTTNWSTRATENKGQTTLQYTGLEANTSYEVQIRSVRIQRAESCFTFSAWSESTTFMTLPAMPARAALSSPTDYALNTATSLNLVVKETAFAANYEIQLSTSQDFSAATTVSFTSASGEQAVDGLLSNTRYYWRARGVNARGAGEWSAMSQFRTGLSVASATVAGQVTCASEGAQVFMWNAIPGASHYRVEIASDANFNTVVKRASVQSLQLIVIDLRVNQTYYWRVQGYNDVSAYVGNWSSAGQLGVQPRIQVAGELELCSNARTTLSLETKAGTSIQWYANGTAIAGATSNSYSANTAGSYYAILTSTGNVCASYQTESVTITEAELSVPAITASSTAVCEGESTTLSTTSATGNSYQWFRNGTAIAGATAQSYRTSEAGTYSVEVRANQTCSVTSNGLAINVTAVPQQQAIRVTGSLTLCGAADATSLSLTLAQGQTIQWYRNGTLLANATGASLSATQAGTYDAIIRNGTCSIRTASVEISGTILAKPVISMSQFGQTQINLGRPVAIQSTYAPTGVGYQWLHNGVSVEGANTAILLASRNGRYQMQLRSADGCTVISEEFVITYPAGKEPKDIPIRSLNPRDLMEIAKEISDGWLQAFPNPTQGMLTISVSADRLAGQESVDVRVVDFLGRGVYNGKLMLTGDRYEVNFNMANLSKGIYYIYVEDGNISHRKVVKKE